MGFVKFSTNEIFDWRILADSATGFPEECVADIVAALSEVKRVFDNLFGVCAVNLRSPLTVLPSTTDFPHVDRQRHIIYLASSGRYYMQQIFQFSHELLHFMISQDVCEDYRWLEETFCAMISWYVLQKIYDQSERHSLIQLRSLYIAMPGYILRDMAKRYPLNGITVSQFIHRNHCMLQRNCYNRLANSTIGYGIYHLFLQFPELWRIVPYMHLIPPEENLPRALEIIKKASGVLGDGANALSLILCE